MLVISGIHGNIEIGVSVFNVTTICSELCDKLQTLVKVKISSSVADNVLHTKPGHLRYDGLMLQRRETDRQ